MVSGNGGSEGYGAPGPDGWGPSSAVGPALSPQAGYGVGSVEPVDIGSIGGSPRAPFASGSAPAAVAPIDSYGAPAADPIGGGSAPVPVAPIDEYGAPAGPILDSSASEPEAIDEYGAPAAPPLGPSGAASAPAPAASAPDSYGAPTADVLPASSVPVGVPAAPASDGYGAPTADVLPASSNQAPAASAPNSYGAPTADVLPASSDTESNSYGAPADGPIIQDNSFAPSAVVEATVSIGDSYGSPRDPAPSSYDAPAVPPGNAAYNRRNWSHQLL